MLERNFLICNKLSHEIYKDTIPDVIDGWEIVAPQAFYGSDLYKKSNLACAAYRKANEVVLVFRGTDDLLDVLADVDICIKKIPPSMKWAKKYYLEVKTANPDCEIWLTGHSLGGAYAQLTSANAINEGCSCRAITFNAPGVSFAIRDNNKIFLERINNYVVMNDWVGNSRAHIGSTYYFQPYPLNVPKKGAKACETPHDCIRYYSKEKHGNHFACPKGWNPKFGVALWVFDENSVSVPQEITRKICDLKVNNKHLTKAIKILEEMQALGQLKLLNSFKFKAFRKKYELRANN